MAAKARQVLSRNAAASQPKTQQNPVPLPESAASLDWSNLVNVATKAIESKDSFFLSVLILCALISSNHTYFKVRKALTITFPVHL